MTSFEVDLDDLRAVLAAMAAQSASLRDLADEVEATASRLDAEWSGLARDAHVTAHARWASDFTLMREALTDLHAIGNTAADNYATAVGANLALWEQVR